MKNHPMRIVGILLGLLLGAVPIAHAGVGVNVTLTSKIFSPSTIAPNGTSTVTITVTNATAAPIAGVTFTDTFPAGMTFTNFAAVPGSPGCTSFVLTGNPGSFVANVTVAANSFCAMSFLVTAGAAGVYPNGPTNFTGWNGNALAFAPAVLTVGSAQIPTLSEFALILLALGLALLAYRIRFRRARSGADPPV